MTTLATRRKKRRNPLGERSVMDPSERLAAILEKNRDAVAPNLPSELLKDINDIEQANQFDADRNKARREIRRVIAAYANKLSLGG